MRLGRRRARAEPSPLRQELDAVAALQAELEARLAVVPPARRALASTALAAAAAATTYRMTDALPEWRNATSEQWRGHLELVWRHLQGEDHRAALSGLLAAHLDGPLHHADGQDGPDDADRPQTTAALAAVTAVVEERDDQHEPAVEQVFDALDLAWDDEADPGRRAEREERLAELRAQLDLLLSLPPEASALPAEMVQRLRSAG